MFSNSSAWLKNPEFVKNQYINYFIHNWNKIEMFSNNKKAYMLHL